MLAILNYLNAHNFIFQPILKTLVSKFMFYRSLPDKTYLSLGLRSPLIKIKVVHPTVGTEFLYLRIENYFSANH